MAVISPDYASPGLRMGLLREDFPSATVTFSMMKGSELGLPDSFGGKLDHCVATIDFRDGVREPVTGYKSVPAKGGTADDWNKLCTQATGRALKRVGYPDDTRDLKALVAWRRQNALIPLGAGEVAQPGRALPAGGVVPQQALGAGSGAPELDAALDTAATPQGRQSDDGDDGYAEIIPDDDVAATISEIVSGLEGRDRANYLGYLASIEAPQDVAEMTPSQRVEVLGWLDPDAE